MSIEYPTLAHFRHFSSLYTNLRSTPVENIRQITPYLKKQTQFQKCKIMQAQYIQGIMKNIAASGHKKTNPIQTQFKPKTKPIQTQFRKKIDRLDNNLNSR
ncbi:MAG: hypothetical protein GY845_10605 [Planctomycetes bacterium]|nr:hypothetical protein [Planctomycetota bacterium]